MPKVLQEQEWVQFAGRKLEEEYRSLVVCECYERIRESGVIRRPAALVATGNRESQTSWKEFLEQKHMKSTNLLERLNEELKRRTLVARNFPNTAACLRLTRALAAGIHEDWIEAAR